MAMTNEKLTKRLESEAEKIKKMEETVEKLKSIDQTPAFNELLENVTPPEEVVLPLILPVLDQKKQIKSPDAGFKKRFYDMKQNKALRHYRKFLKF